MNEPEFPKWPELFDDVKLKIITMMDFRTRRLLRNCSHADKLLVEKFPYRKEIRMRTEQCCSTGKWYCEYQSGEKSIAPQNMNPVFKYFFENCEEAYNHMKKTIKTAQIVSELRITSELNSKIKLRDFRKLINVEKLFWFFTGEESNGEIIECYNHLFSQINLPFLKSIYVDTENVRNTNPIINNKLFEIQKRAVKLEDFAMNGLIDDEQLLCIRGNNIFLYNGSSITSSAFVRFITEKLLHPPPNFLLHIYQISVELQFYLFGMLYTQRRDSHLLLLNVPRSDFKLEIECYQQEISDETDTADYEEPSMSTIIHMRFCRLENYIQPNPYEVNTRSLGVFPKLYNFIHEISKITPLGFPLIYDLRNR